MLGSSQTQNQPYYNYTLILPMDEKQEKSLRIRSDLDFNVDAEASYPIKDGVLVKSSAQLSDNGNALVLAVDLNDDNSTTQVECNMSTQTSLGLNFMQALTPQLSLGGSNTYVLGKESMKSTVAGSYEDDGHLLAATYEIGTQNVSF